MNYLSALVCLSFAAFVAAAPGYYVPRAFYMIDESGNPSPLVYINSIPEALHRARRQIQPFQPLPGFAPLPFPFPAAPIGCPPGGNCQSITTTQTLGGGPDLASRFGEENSGSVGQTITTTVTNNGQQTTTIHQVRPDGSVHQVSGPGSNRPNQSGTTKKPSSG